MVRDIAVAVELIHLASLVHDDVIDSAHLRRGRESLNARFGNHASVLAGDYLFAAAFNIINRHQQNQVMENITHTIQVMCSGEIMQMGQAYNLNIGLEEYYDKIYRKTACLFASSCKIGSLISQAGPEQTRQLEQFGLCLGYAYQIIDDVMDLVADSAILGKPVGNDITQGNTTLPVILALQKRAARSESKPSWSAVPASPPARAIINMLIESGSIVKPSNTPPTLERGQEHLAGLPEGENLEILKRTCMSFIDHYRPVLGRYHPLMERQA